MKIIDHANQASFNSALVKKYNYSHAHLNKLFDGILKNQHQEFDILKNE